MVGAAALIGAVLVMLDGESGEVRPAPTTAPVITVPTTVPTDVVRLGPWYLMFERSGIERTLPDMGNMTLASLIQFEPDGVLRGGTGVVGGCDEFTADYTLEDRALTIGPLTGRFDCIAAAAIDIRGRLGAVAAYELVNDELALLDRFGNRLLVYARRPQV